MKQKINKLLSMIGPKEKGIEPIQVESPPSGSYEGVDLKNLPKFICYKAALLKEKMTLKSILSILLLIFCCHYCSSRIEVSNLHQKLREKEYILAPGVLDFTTASPQAVPDSYVNDAVTDFLSDLGNVSGNNIDEQYNSLKRFMSDKLKVTFEMETADWIEQVKSEGISQILTVMNKEIKTDNDGNYQVVATARAEFYANQQYLGHEDQVIEMSMKLTPPQKSHRWYLQLTSLSWTKADAFKTKTNLSQP
ncbi:MAG: hypothetical protein AB7I27_15535 [Bacteriovoracaceae bacterium]